MLLDIYKKICRFFYWGWHLRNNHEYDFAYIYRMLHLKLSRIYKYYVELNANPKAHYRLPTKSLHKLKTCILLLDRMLEEKYHCHYFENRNYSPDDDLFVEWDIDLMEKVEYSENRERYIRELFFYMFEKYHRDWWD